MLINFSNHSSELWSYEQLKAAKEYGEILDLAFPDVRPEATEEEVSKMANSISDYIISLSPEAVLCQGEFTLSYGVISRLISSGIKVISACSKRITSEEMSENNVVKKVSFYKFVKFRCYS